MYLLVDTPIGRTAAGWDGAEAGVFNRGSSFAAKADGTAAFAATAVFEATAARRIANLPSGNPSEIKTRYCLETSDPVSAARGFRFACNEQLINTRWP